MNIPNTIGIIGGGQLAKMLTIAAKKMGFTVIISDPTPKSPAGQVADEQLIGDYKDSQTTTLLAKKTQVLTIDAEFVNDTVLESLEKNGTHIFPRPTTIALIKDKFLQKTFLASHHIPTAPFFSVDSFHNDIAMSAKRTKYPFLLKARFDAYDGKGNFVVKNKKSITKGLSQLHNRPLYIEEYIPFIKELAVMVVRSKTGEIKAYPVVETIHRNNICDLVICPAPIPATLSKKATTLAKKVVEAFDGVGIFGVEMFLKKDHTILINEIAPRVHNSGHYTIEACITSQFEQHIRAITGLPLGETSLITPAVVMKNILGTTNREGFPTGIERALAIKGVSLHLYGKHISRPGRKMGHITVIGKNTIECMKKAEKARKALTI